MNNVVILLTACINPNGMAYTVLQDRDVRLQQYREALDWYLAHVKNKIVFVENTGYDISPLYESFIKSGQLEVLTFQGNDFNKSKGKGYGEALIVDYAIHQSKFIKEATSIAKITGRLIIKNLNSLLKEAKSEKTVYAKYASRTQNNVLMYESFFFVAPVRFLRDYFLLKKESINDSKYFYFERVLHSTARTWEKMGNSRREFLLPVFVKGISGSTGREYGQSRFPYIINIIKWVYHKMPAYQKMGDEIF